MCLSRNNFPAAAAPLVFSLIVCSCGFMDLRPIGFAVEPAVSDTILSGAYTPLVLSFDTEMEKPSVEGIFKVSSSLGVVNGDISWEGNRLSFVPAASWTAGTRYTIGLSGLALSVDGRELRLEKNISFYAINKSAIPLVKAFSPADGASVDIQKEKNGEDFSAWSPEVIIHFSIPMEKSRTESAFSIDGFGEKKFRWSNDDTTLGIIPEKKLLPWTIYSWTLNTGAQSRDGVPLAKAVSAQFTTDRDRLIPRVERIYPVLQSDGIWRATGGSIETELGPAQGIAIQFNKPMGANVGSAVRFDPSLPGRIEKIFENTIVFIPNKDPRPETAYTLIVSSDAADSLGLRTGEEYRTVFTADIPRLRVLSFEADGAPAIENPDNAARAYAVPVDVPGGGVLRYTIRFSLPFDEKVKQDAALKISLTPFFPSYLDPVALRFVTWLSDDTVRMEWEGLSPGTSAQPSYFRLFIPGGRGGIESGAGMFLANDQYIYLEVGK